MTWMELAIQITSIVAWPAAIVTILFLLRPRRH